jgi:hypothetical protein
VSQQKVMGKEFYRSLLPLVNDKDHFDILVEYADQRIEVLRTLLETSKDPSRILEIQGSITELRRIATLRHETLKGAE